MFQNTQLAVFQQCRPSVCKMPNLQLGSSCGSVVRAVASNTRGPLIESSHRQDLIYLLLTVEKTKIKKKVAGKGPILFKKQDSIFTDSLALVFQQLLMTSDIQTAQRIRTRIVEEEVEQHDFHSATFKTFNNQFQVPNMHSL